MFRARPVVCGFWPCLVLKRIRGQTWFVVFEYGKDRGWCVSRTLESSVPNCNTDFRLQTTEVTVSAATTPITTTTTVTL